MIIFPNLNFLYIIRKWLLYGQPQSVQANYWQILPQLSLEPLSQILFVYILIVYVHVFGNTIIVMHIQQYSIVSHDYHKGQGNQKRVLQCLKKTAES
jgi:hypothetical protein